MSLSVNASCFDRLVYIFISHVLGTTCQSNIFSFIFIFLLLPLTQLSEHGINKIQKAPLVVDLVIAHIPKGFMCMDFQYLLFLYPLEMQNPINVFLFYFHFACNMFMMMVLYWYFIVMMRNGQKNIFLFLQL